MRLALGFALALCVSSAAGSAARAADRPVEVGFGEADITPAVDGATPVWIAGYGQNRRAQSVHDPLHVRAVVLRQGADKIALVSADIVGLHYTTTQEIRARLDDFTYVMVASTHNHEGPDTMGLWGPSPFKSGIDPEYMTLLKDRAVEAVRQAEAAAVAATAQYGTAEDASLLRDSRLPEVYDPVLRVVEFRRAEGGERIGILVQWNNHPECLGGSNPHISADFPGYTVAELVERYACPVAYFTGPVGGLMAPPRGIIKGDDGRPLQEGDFEYARRYGIAVADLAQKAIEAAEPLSLNGLVVRSRTLALPVTNPVYLAARGLGIMKREGVVWTGDPYDLSQPVTAANANQPAAIVSEVACLRLGELYIACIPGELYPEAVYGEYQEPVEPNVDFPDAPLEPPVAETLPGERILIFGLANDEVGYIVPKRQWDDAPPFAYGRETKQYGEVNSLGPETCPILMRALVDVVADLPPAGSPSPAAAGGR